MKPVIVTNPPRADLALVEELGRLGVATVHEAAGRTGLLGSGIRPLRPGQAAAGTAITVLCPPGDNLMVHAAIEQAGPGDILVITTTSPCDDGYLGELIVTALTSRGVRGLVTTTGVRDVAEITGSGFGVWSRHVSAQGTVKATAGWVNVPVSIGATLVTPGDAVVADDDGVVVIPRLEVAEVAEAGRQRAGRENEARAAFARGELSLDRNGLRPLLEQLGVRYVTLEDLNSDSPIGTGER